MKNTERLTDREWEELASILSEEKSKQSEIYSQFMAEDSYDTEKHWKNLKKMSSKKEINVDNAWNKVHARMEETSDIAETLAGRTIFMRSTFMKIAAVTLILLSLGSVIVYLNRTGNLSKKIVATTGNDQTNLKVILPDGSSVFLNRNTEMSYRASFVKSGRNVALKGEAFFEITSDVNNPFTVDAGTAKVKVLGTSFNVITNNPGSAVEVFVKTGQVMLSDSSGIQNLVLDPGYVGTIDSKLSRKTLNNNPNYMAWNTGLLVYNGQKLDVVFKDLKRAYDMEIIADDPDILNETWVSQFDNETQDTIIRLICLSFNLSYTKDGNVYHLTKK
ncbi:MAG: FecR domain-containing protein [Bacteroidales bacterium]|nr:FecR domain-containing protein [Bacteroidales bacterium]